MSEQNNAVPVELPEWVDAVADRFEQAWRAMAPPRLTDFVGEVSGEARAALEDELREIDRIYRQRIGERRHPQDVAAVQGPHHWNDAAVPSGATPADLPRNDTIGSLPRPLLPEPLPSPYPEVPGFEILDELGQGGMGVVYRARQPALKRTVALKMLHIGTDSSPRRVERFRVESAAAAGLQHPNLVQVYEVGEHDGRPYFVMEFVDGGSLAQRLDGTPLPPRQAAALVETLARAMHHAHEHGVIHRDLKPANVMLTDGMVPKITDFGMAKQLEGESSQTQSGEILGTPSYMAPEQARGQTKLIGPGSDVYGLGAILYELLTGRAPFKGASMLDTLDLVRTEEPIAPRQLQPKVPRDVETICLKCLAKASARRYLTALELAEELRRFQDGVPIAARPVGRVEKAWRWCKRKPVVAGLILTSMLLLASTSTLAGMRWFEYDRQRESELRRTEAEWREVLAAESSRAQAQVLALQDQARLRLRVPTLGRQKDTQDILKKVSEPRRKIVVDEFTERADLVTRSLFAHSLGVLDLQEETTRLPDDPSQFWQVALHPDGKKMAVSTPRGPRLWERGKPFKRDDLEKVKEKQRPHLVYSPDGSYLAAALPEGGLELWDEDLTRKMREWKEHRSRVLAIGFGPQSKALWICCQDGWVEHLSMPDLQRVARWRAGGKAEQLTAAAFNRDATRLAVGDRHGRVWLHQGTEQVKEEISASESAVEALAWSPGRHLAVGTAEGFLMLWSVVDKPRLSYKFVVSNAGVTSVAFDPGERWVLAGFRNGHTKIWDMMTGEQVLTGPCIPWNFSRDGKSYAAGNTGGIAFCDLIPPARIVQRLSGHRATPDGHLAWCRDNRHLASLDAAFEVRMWDVEQGRGVGSFKPPSGEFHSTNAAVAISDDARYVAYASGGRESQVLIRDVRDGKDIGPWKLPGGFERMTCLGGTKFLLVREQLEKGQALQTVAWELSVDKPPQQLRVVRRSRDGDQAGFLYSGLTPDGRYYWWSGPRSPAEKRRIEVWDVAAGELVTAVEPPTPALNYEPSATLSPDGRLLGVYFGKDKRLYDLKDPGPFKQLAHSIPCVSSTGWLAYGVGSSLVSPQEGLALRPMTSDKVWLEFVNEDMSGTEPTFSPDGRYLAWPSESGPITVVDVPALEKEVGAFEKAVLGK